jgi:hypothetical protein
MENQLKNVQKDDHELSVFQTVACPRLQCGKFHLMREQKTKKKEMKKKIQVNKEKSLESK